MKRKESRANRYGLGAVGYSVDGVQGKPCSNSKFMHIAGLPGMVSKTSHDTYYNEETTSVYLGDELMAERIMDCLHFPGEKSRVSCFIFGYKKDQNL